MFAAILAVLSIGLVSCGNENNPSQPSNNPTTPSNNSQTPSVKNSYTFDVNGELKEGMTVTLIFKNNGSAIVEQASVVYSVDDASKATVSGIRSPSLETELSRSQPLTKVKQSKKQ